MFFGVLSFCCVECCWWFHHKIGWNFQKKNPLHKKTFLALLTKLSNSLLPRRDNSQSPTVQRKKQKESPLPTSPVLVPSPHLPSNRRTRLSINLENQSPEKTIKRKRCCHATCGRCDDEVDFKYISIPSNPGIRIRTLTAMKEKNRTSARQFPPSFSLSPACPSPEIVTSVFLCVPPLKTRKLFDVFNEKVNTTIIFGKYIAINEH